MYVCESKQYGVWSRAPAQWRIAKASCAREKNIFAPLPTKVQNFKWK